MSTNAEKELDILYNKVKTLGELIKHIGDEDGSDELAGDLAARVLALQRHIKGLNDAMKETKDIMKNSKEGSDMFNVGLSNIEAFNDDYKALLGIVNQLGQKYNITMKGIPFSDVKLPTTLEDDKNAEIIKAMHKVQAEEASALSRSLAETKKQNDREVEKAKRDEAKATARAERDAENEVASAKLTVERDTIKQKNALELEAIKQRHKDELSSIKNMTDEERSIIVNKAREAEVAAQNESKQLRQKQLADTKTDYSAALAHQTRLTLEATKHRAALELAIAQETVRETAKAEREAAREAAKEKRELDRENARNQREVAKAEREATRQKEKDEREAAREAAKAERDSAREAEKAARDKKDAWKTVGDTIKKVASTITSAMSKALSLIKKDIQLTVSLAKKATTAFKTIGNTALRVLNLFGNFGDRLKQFFDKGIINGITSGLNKALNSIVDIPDRILNNRFVQVGESLLSSIQSLNIIIGNDLTNNTIAWAKELERGFGLSADGLISDMKGVAGVMKGLGMTGGDTATAAKNLTVMSRSFSVMLGYKPEEAMSKIESGMKGMTASVDDLGISVREAEMNSFLKELKARGGEFSNIATSFSNLNEEQRVYVRYAAMIDQYLKAFSIEKYAKSLDTITGRLSILREQTRAFISAVGNLFLQMFNKIVVPLTYTINWLTSKIKALTNYLGLSSELSADINGATDAVSTTIDTSGTVDGLNKEADALDKVNKAAKEAKGGIDSFDHVTSMRSSSSSSGSGSDDGTGSDFDYSKLMDLNADDIASKMEQMSKVMDDYTNSAKQKTVEGLQKIKSAIDKWYKEQTNEDLDWSRIFNSKGLDKTFSTLLNNIKRSIKGVTNIIGPLLLKVAQDINLNKLLRKSLTLVTEAFGALADALEFIKPIFFELYDEIISPLVIKLGEKLSAALDNATNRLKKFREDIKSGKYTNIKIVIRTLLTGETSENDLNYLKGNDIMKGTNLSRLNTIAEKIHAVFEEIYTLVKSTASIIFDTIKETFNGEHKTLLDVIKSTLEKVSNFVSENHDAIVEILTALLELQATVIEAVVNVILDIAKWIVEHKDLVVSVLNKIKDIVEWLGNHTGVVVAFVAALTGLKIITTITTLVGSFTTALGALKTALNIGGATSAAGTGGGLFGRLFGRGTSTGTPTATNTMPDIGGARSTDLGGNATAGAAGATGATGLKAFATKAAFPAAGATLAVVGSDLELKREHDKLVEQSQDWRGLSEEVRKTEMALAKANGQGFIGTGADATSLESGGFFGLFKTIGSYFDKGDTILNTEFVAQRAKENAEKIKNALDGEKATYDQIEKLLEGSSIYKEFKDLGYGEEVTNAAIEHFRAVLYSELEDSIYKDTNKLSDNAVKVNSHINDYVKKVSDSSVESQYKLKTTVDSSINTINNSTDTMKNSFRSIYGGINNVYSTMQNMMSTAINSVESLRSNVKTLSTDVQGLNADTGSALSAIQSIMSTARSAMYSAISGVMGTVNNVVGIPSVRSIFGYANGGMPRSGQMFIAREDGMPELVGSFGGYSGVANNDMIIKAMREAIYDGTRAANASGGTNSNSGGTVNFNNYGYFGGDQASFRKFAAMINNANRSSNSNIANKTFRS